MKRLIFTIILFISFITFSYGQNVTVTSSFDSSRIYIGDQIKFTLTVDKPEGLKLHMPILKDTLTKNIEILSGPRIDSTLQNGRVKLREKYTVTSFDSGHYSVKPLFVETKSEAGLKRFYSDYSVLDVTRIKIAPADSTTRIFDIVEPRRAPITLAEVLPWFLLIILLAAIAWSVIRYLRKLQKDKVGEEAYIPPDPAHVIAFRELEQLKNEGLWQKGETKKYYTRLTEILRQYLENRFAVYSLELTSSETLDALIKTGFKKNGSYNILKSVLSGADLVKFAKYNPSGAENEEHFLNAWNFVDATLKNEQSSASESEESTIISKEETL